MVYIIHMNITAIVLKSQLGNAKLNLQVGKNRLKKLENFRLNLISITIYLFRCTGDRGGTTCESRKHKSTKEARGVGRYSITGLAIISLYQYLADGTMMPEISPSTFQILKIL